MKDFSDLKKINSENISQFSKVPIKEFKNKESVELGIIKIRKYKKQIYLAFIYLFCIIITILLILYNMTYKQLEKELEELQKELLTWQKRKDGVAICAIGKNENLYINEWIDYYKYLGIRKIFLYDNNEIDGERFEDVLDEKDLKSKFIEIINVRGLKYYQGNAYANCLEKFGDIYDWLLVIDIDEFLYITNNVTLEEFLQNERYNDCDTIKINFRCFDDNDQLYYENKPVQERFTRLIKKNTYDKYIKSFVRGRKNIKWPDSSGITNAHFPYTINPKKICNSLGKKMKNLMKTSYPIYTYAYLNHYTIKSLEEYINKIKRGRAIIGDKYTPIEKYTSIYFRFNNNITLEKIEMLEKSLNISLNYYKDKIEV